MSEYTGLPVHGYQPQASAKVGIVNVNKQLEERMLRRLDWLWSQPGLDKRWLSIAKTRIEEGYMAMNRAVFQPQRIALPEDGEAPPSESPPAA